MDRAKRNKRKAEKSRRFQTLRERTALRATVTMYGRGGEVEYMVVALHKGSQVVEARFFDACHYADGEAMCQDAMGFAHGPRVELVQLVQELLPPESDAEGHRTFRIVDRGPEAVI